MQNPKALIFMTARNCEMYAAASLESLARQTHSDLHVLYVDDFSDDATPAIAQQYLTALFPGRHTFIRNPERFGKARNAWEHLRPLASSAEFIAVLDGDDQLADAAILSRMARSYRDGKDVVWTNYVTDGGMVGGNGPLSPEKDPRRQGWKTSHFFSFRAMLLTNVTVDYFKRSTGEWLQAACDIALALPIVDQTRRYEFIPVNAYRYTSFNPYSHHNLDPKSKGLNSTIQQECAREVFNKIPLPLIRPLHEETPTQVRQEKMAPVADRGSVWEDKASELLVVACPTLLNAEAVIGQNGLSPLQTWSLFQGLERNGDKNILHIGTNTSAVYLSALVACVAGSRLTCLSPGGERLSDLKAKLSTSGLDSFANVVESRFGSLQIGDRSGPFIDLTPLDTSAQFTFIVVDARDHENEEAFVGTTFPALAALLGPRDFRLHILTNQKTALRDFASQWREKVTGLNFCLEGIGGTGLVISVAR